MATGQEAFVVSAEVKEAWVHEAAVREALWMMAVDTLTRAARSTRTLAGGQVEPAERLVDVDEVGNEVAGHRPHSQVPRADVPDEVPEIPEVDPPGGSRQVHKWLQSRRTKVAITTPRRWRRSERPCGSPK